MADTDITQSTIELPWNESTYRRLIDLELILTLTVVILTNLLAFLQNPIRFTPKGVYLLFLGLYHLYQMSNLLNTLYSPGSSLSNSSMQRFRITPQTHPYRIHQILRRDLIIQVVFVAMLPALLISPLILLEPNPVLLLTFSMGFLLLYFTYRRYPCPPTFPPAQSLPSMTPSQEDCVPSTESHRLMVIGAFFFLFFLFTTLFVLIAQSFQIELSPSLVFMGGFLNFLSLLLIPGIFIYSLLIYYEHHEPLLQLYTNRT